MSLKQEQQIEAKQQQQQQIKQQNAVQTSIKKYKDCSYYYGHAKLADQAKKNIQSLGGNAQQFQPGKIGITQGGDPIKVKQELQPDQLKRVTKDMHPYTWANLENKVKVYFELEDPEFEGVTDENVEAQFQERSLKIRLYAPKIHTQFIMEKDFLYKEIIPKKCSFRVAPGSKLTIILWKEKGGEKWFGVETCKT